MYKEYKNIYLVRFCNNGKTFVHTHLSLDAAENDASFLRESKIDNIVLEEYEINLVKTTNVI